jgi:hypothetical protein
MYYFERGDQPWLVPHDAPRGGIALHENRNNITPDPQ